VGPLPEAAGCSRARGPLAARLQQGLGLAALPGASSALDDQQAAGPGLREEAAPGAAWTQRSAGTEPSCRIPGLVNPAVLRGMTR
jgi:hypothetical protein